MSFFSRIKNYLYWKLNIDEIYNKMPDEEFLKKRYRKRLGRTLELSDPSTFSEKMQWLKLNNRRPEYAVMVDKFAAKNYVANILGDKYVTPTLGVWDHYAEIDFDSLPEKFVLKCTHNAQFGDFVCRHCPDILTLIVYCAAIGGKHATDHIDCRSFAGTVGANERMYLAIGNVHGKVVDGGKSAECLGQVTNF